MQMRENNRFFSFALDSAHVKFDVWTGPKTYLKIWRQVWQSTIHLVYLPALSTHEILYPRRILGQKIGGFHVAEDFPGKHV